MPDKKPGLLHKKIAGMPLPLVVIVGGVAAYYLWTKYRNSQGASAAATPTDTSATVGQPGYSDSTGGGGDGGGGGGGSSPSAPPLSTGTTGTGVDYTGTAVVPTSTTPSSNYSVTPNSTNTGYVVTSPVGTQHVLYPSSTLR